MPALTPARYQPVSLDGASLTLAGLASIVAGAPALVDPSALDRARLGQEAADRVTAERHVYGRTTGVGAGREEVTSAPVAHGLRLLRAHAAGWGEPLPRGRRALRPGDPRQPAAGRRLGRHARPRRRARRAGLRPGG